MASTKKWRNARVPESVVVVGEKPLDDLLEKDLIGSSMGIARSVRRRVMQIKSLPASKTLPVHIAKAIEKERQKLNRNKKSFEENKQKQRLENKYVADIWNGDNKDTVKNQRQKKVFRVLSCNSVVVAEEQQRAVAVPLPLPGQSYNPKDSHREAVMLQAVSQIEDEERRFGLEERNDSMTEELSRKLENSVFVDSLDVSTKILAFRMCQQKCSPEEIERFCRVADRTNSVVVEADDDGVTSEHQVTVIRDKKSRTQRNKEAKRKLVEQQLDKSRKLKTQRRAFDSLHDVVEKICTDKDAVSNRFQFRKEKRETRVQMQKLGILPMRSKIGKHKYLEPPAEVVLPVGENGESSLRAFESSNSCVSERMQSFYRRGLVELPPAHSFVDTKRVRKELKDQPNPLIRKRMPILA